MAVSKGVWGIDIGQCALKALRLEMIDGKPTATAFDYVEHTKILSQPDADPDALIREALEKFLSRNQIKNDEVAIGIAGQSGLARFVKLPPVEEKKIAEIVKFEAKQQIPFPLDEVVWDYQKIAGGEAVDGFALETEIGLFAMKRDVISRYLGYFNSSKIEVHAVQMSPLALVNFATYEILKKGGTPAEGEAAAADAPAEDDAPRGKKRCAVVMDIGTDASNLIITDGAKIIWQRPIPLGGNNFTRALTKELKLTFAKAEHLKRNAAKSPEMANILRAIKPVLTDFVGEVQRSLGYFTNTHRDAHVAYMVGLGSAFKLPGLQKYLGDKLSLEVRKPAKFARLSGDTILADPLFQENLLTFPVAYGLALQTLGQARLTTNLLPSEIARDRMIRAKKPFAVAAAAMLLVGTVGMAWGFGKTLASVQDPRIEQGEKSVKNAVSAHSGQESKWSGKLTESQTNQANVKTILAGQEERLNWPRFFEVATASLPHPGEANAGGNLNEKPDPSDPKKVDQVSLWKGDSDAGVEALKWFERRLRTGVPIEQAAEDEKSDKPKDLAMVNIEAVHTRWVHNPAEFLAAADNAVYGDPTKNPNPGYGKNISEYLLDNEKVNDEERKRFKPAWNLKEGEQQPPGVWVVEIRGYTDHNAGPTFIKNALIRNLQKFDAFAADQKDEDKKVGKYIIGVADPVKGKVSHVFVYNWWEYDDVQPNTFRYINQSFLDKLVGGGAAASGQGNTGATAMPGSGGGMPPGGMGGMGGGGQAAAAKLGPAWRGLTDTSANSGKGGGSAGVTGRRRYEFVVMLLWREPVPSGSPPAGEGGGGGGSDPTGTMPAGM